MDPPSRFRDHSREPLAKGLIRIGRQRCGGKARAWRPARSSERPTSGGRPSPEWGLTGRGRAWLVGTATCLAEVVPEGRTAERTGSIGGDGFGGDLALAPASTTIAPSIDVSGAPASAATDEGSTGGPTLPLGWSGAGQSLTLLTLLAALTTTVRAFRHPILFSIVPRAVALQSAALSLSVERPG